MTHNQNNQPGRGKGGRRRGAGAPKGNKNAVKHGHYSGDPKFAALWRSLTPEQQEFFLPLVKHSGATLPGVEAELARAANVVPMRPSAVRLNSSPQFTQTQRDSIKQPRFTGIILELQEMGFMRAAAFVEVHAEVVEVLEGILGDLRQLKEIDAAGYQAIASKPAWIRQQFHLEVSVRTGRLLQCPYCGRKEYLVGVDIGEERQSS